MPLSAISAETGTTAWTLDEGTGEVLVEMNLGSPVSGFPSPHVVDGRQYVLERTGRRQRLALERDAARATAEQPARAFFVFTLP